MGTTALATRPVVSLVAQAAGAGLPRYVLPDQARSIINAAETTQHRLLLECLWQSARGGCLPWATSCSRTAMMSLRSWGGRTVGVIARRGTTSGRSRPAGVLRLRRLSPGRQNDAIDIHA
jgi:hypothetical protein